MAKESIKERLKRKKEELKSRSEMGDIVFLKDGDPKRVRILNMGEENDFIKEVTQFYLGSEIKGVISPSTFGEPCAIMETYEELKNSEEDEDKELATKFSPRNKYLAFCAFYKDNAGKELDTNLSPRFVLLTSGLYQDIIDLYLDEDEWGDMTDPEDGYDIKLSRSGKGMTDTEYSVNPCKPTRAPREFRNKVYDLDEEVRKIIPSYEETQRLLDKFLGTNSDDEDDKPRKKKPVKKRPVKKRRTSDTD